MLVSLICAVGSDFRPVRRLLDSVWRTIPAGLEWELLLLADNERTLAYNRTMRVIQRKHAKSWLAACNQGAFASSGEILVFLLDRLELLPGWIEPMLAALKDDIGMVGGRLLLPNGQHVFPLRIDRCFRLPRSEKCLFPDSYCTPGAEFFACRANDFRQAKGFDTRFPSPLAELDLSLKLAKRNLKSVIEPDAQALIDEINMPLEPHPMQMREFQRRWWKVIENYEARHMERDKRQFAIRIPAVNGNAIHGDELQVAQCLARALIKDGNGCRIRYATDTPIQADVTININMPTDTKQQGLNIVWALSWPGYEPQALFENCDVFCVASQSYARAFANVCPMPVFYLPAATDKELFNLADIAPSRHGLVFIGDRSPGQNCIDKLAASHLGRKVLTQTTVFGKGWNQGALVGATVADVPVYMDLGKILANFAVYMADMDAADCKYGFVSHRIYDAFACGLTVYSCNTIHGLDKGFKIIQIDHGDIAHFNEEVFEDCARQNSLLATSEYSYDNIVKNIKDIVARLG